MHQFSMAHASGGGWAPLVKSCVDQLAAARADGNLGFLYVTDILAEDLSSILTFLRERTRIEDWVGSVGLGICVTGHEYYDEPAVAVMTARLPENWFHLLPRIAGNEGIEKIREEGWMDGLTPGLAIVHADPRNPHTPEIIENVAAGLSCYLVGGMSSSRGVFPQIAGKIVDGGLSGVVLSAEVPIAVGLTQGCTPVGPAHAVTSCEDHVLIELDDRPALEVLREDISADPAGDLTDELADIHVALPIPGSDTGDYLVRNLIGVGPGEDWIAVGEMIRPGQTVRFCRRDVESAEADLVRMLGDLRRRSRKPPRAGIYFSCVGRGPNLFGPHSEELSIIREVLGDFPLVGFFGNGEISHDRLYGYTGVLTLFL